LDAKNDNLDTPSHCDAAKENVWVNCGRQTLTAVDKSLILKDVATGAFIIKLVVAIANCICLAENRSPPTNHDQAKMRQHLVDCM